MDNQRKGFSITAIGEIKILKLHHENVIQLKEIVTLPGSLWTGSDKEKAQNSRIWRKWPRRLGSANQGEGSTSTNHDALQKVMMIASQMGLQKNRSNSAISVRTASVSE